MNIEDLTELKKRNEEYTRYIDEHRNYIKKALSQFLKMKIVDLSQHDIEMLSSAVESHDISKYGIEEFEPYRKHFFPCSFENKMDSEKEFQIAVQHHYLVNDHHPQNPSRKDGLNKIACIHNVLDWIAMSYKFKDNIWDFYSNSKISQKINPLEKEYIEKILDEMKLYKNILYENENEEER